MRELIDAPPGYQLGRSRDGISHLLCNPFHARRHQLISKRILAKAADQRRWELKFRNRQQRLREDALRGSFEEGLAAISFAHAESNYETCETIAKNHLPAESLSTRIQRGGRRE